MCPLQATHAYADRQRHELLAGGGRLQPYSLRSGSRFRNAERSQHNRCVLKGECLLLVRRARQRIPEEYAQSARLLFHSSANSVCEQANSERPVWVVSITSADLQGTTGAITTLNMKVSGRDPCHVCTRWESVLFCPPHTSCKAHFGSSKRP